MDQIAQYRALSAEIAAAREKHEAAMLPMVRRLQQLSIDLPAEPKIGFSELYKRCQDSEAHTRAAKAAKIAAIRDKIGGADVETILDASDLVQEATRVKRKYTKRTQV